MVQNFFIVGVQKAGTTALHAILGLHPQLSMSTPKEIHFFDDESLDWSNPPYARLDAAFNSSPDALLRGEATPIYCYLPECLERLKRYDPGAKLILLLRHPVFRAYSHWRMETRRGAEQLPLSDAIRSGRDRVRLAPSGLHPTFSYVERGFYADQIRRILSNFPRDQVHFEIMDRLWTEPRKTVAEVERFLGVPHRIDPSSNYITLASTDVDQPLSVADRSYLMEVFYKDMKETKELTDLPMSGWFDEDYAEIPKTRCF